MLFSKASDNKKPGLFERMKQALGATKANLVSRIESAITRRPEITEDLFDELEEVLLGADVGVSATTQIITAIRAQCRKHLLTTPDDVRTAIRKQLLGILESASAAGAGRAEAANPEVWIVVGVNGTGKTTTIGKLAARLAREGGKILVCASDTFRPAAIEQLAVWAQRSGADLIRSRQGADPSAVLHDALSAAQARNCDVVIVDTAGRLHTRGNLMQELEKMRRVAGRQVAGAPHEVLLVIDATTGQNGLAQAREFLKIGGVTGLIVTKLDGTAKGGVLFGIAQELKISVRFVGVGETIDDLLDFSPESFVDSLFASNPP
ncbi:MAG: signal recognition particle-docking protein FtsY [Acidobacteriota bacterium]